jgi:hypothetical protein
MMSDAVYAYRLLEACLVDHRLRDIHADDDPDLTERMLSAWNHLTPAEQSMLDAEGPSAPNPMGAVCLMSIYRRLRETLLEIRRRYPGDSPQEETHLDTMDRVWKRLAPEQIAELRHPSACP